MGNDLGTPIDWTPAVPPGRDALVGARVQLEPLDPARHADDLYASLGGDPHLWDYLPYGPFQTRADFDAYMHEKATGSERFYAIVDRRTGGAMGIVCFLRIEPAHGRIEIGHVWFGAPMQRTAAATETVWLLARHAFGPLRNRRLEWKCNALNARSRRAAQRFGFTYEGTFRQDMVVKGRNRDTDWFAMLDGEWPAIDAAFRAWLDPANFDADGRQRRTLEELRG
jgi:RimJ/RimL family protein N-acetyltransferase